MNFSASDVVHGVAGSSRSAGPSFALSLLLPIITPSLTGSLLLPIRGMHKG
jgi:hypothetical protein